MNVLTVSLISVCNYSCWYCPVKKWLMPIEEWQSKRHLNNAALLQWLDKYLDPNEWFIELTGGEPGLYPEIDTLVPALADRGYNGMIKTNGSLPLPVNSHFPRITAWHQGVEEIPLYFDGIVIIENPQDCWEEKAAYCKEHDIPYKTVLFDRQYEGQKSCPAYDSDNKTEQYLHINSRGQITPCPRVAVEVRGECYTVFNMLPPVPLKLSDSCPRCKNIHDVELFI